MRNDTRGFSLVEVLIVSFFLVLLVVAVITSGVEMRSVFQATGTSVSLQQEARLAMNSMLNGIIDPDLNQYWYGLRNAFRSSVVITKDTPVTGFDRIRYQIPLDQSEPPDGVPDLVSGEITADPQFFIIGAQQNGDDIELVLYKRWQTPQVISENIKSIEFQDSTDDSSLYPTEIRIILELEKTDADGRTDNMVLTSTVNLRI
ncbi:MAG: hypothetical protein GF409_03635 [Candidatus Omnitrophica bacterium]|nr:hypothetical protein [Candidatus Omnitrophota bacterium]